MIRVVFAVAALILALGIVAACNDDDDDADVADDPATEETTPTSEPEPTPEPDPTPTEEPEETPEPDPTPTEASEPDPTPEPDPSPTPEDDAAMDEPTEHVVEIVNPHNFEPQEITVSPGDTITWVNTSDIQHTSTLDPEIARDPDNAQRPDGADTWDSGTLDPGDEFSITLEVPGDYVYFCIPHEVLGQIGYITVEEP